MVAPPRQESRTLCAQAKGARAVALRPLAPIRPLEPIRFVAPTRLLADVKTANDIEVALRIHHFQVIQQPTPATHHHQQAPPTGVVLLVRAQMLSQLANTSCQNGDLYFGRAGIIFRSLEIANQNLFTLFRDGHLRPRLLFVRPCGLLGAHCPWNIHTAKLAKNFSYIYTGYQTKEDSLPPQAEVATANQTRFAAHDAGHGGETRRR